MNLPPSDHAAILHAREILARYITHYPITLSDYQAVLNFATLNLTDTDPQIEHFDVLYLDRKNRLITHKRLSSGTVDHVPVYPREVLKHALLLNASAMILVHNHPSQDPTPSRDDITMTKTLVKAASIFNITVHDHFIITTDPTVYYSLKANGDF